MIAFLNRLPLSRKLTLMLLLFVAGFCGFAFYVATSIRTMNDSYSRIVDLYMPISQAVSEFDTLKADYNGMVISHIISTTPEAINKADLRIADQKQKVTAQLDLIKTQDLDADEKSLASDLEQIWGQYLAKSETALSFSRQNQNEEALGTFSSLEGDYLALSGVLDKLQEKQRIKTKESNDIGDSIYTHERTNSVIGVGAFLLMALLAYLYIRFQISQPMNQSVGITRQLAAGELDIAVPNTVRTDEVGQILKSLLVFKESGLQNRAAEVREKDENESRARRANALAQITRQFEEQAKMIVGLVASASTQLEGTATNMSALAEQTANQSGAAAHAGDRASANVQTVAAATEELSASISEISRQIEGGTAITQSTVAQAEAVTLRMEKLGEAAVKIGSVVGLINDVASQTNLLALNATIEAARAGEAGKGFAVVASEVKNLATQTMKATSEIAEQINSIQQAIEGSIGAVGDINLKIGEISGVTSSIAAAVQEQDAATRDITVNVQQVAADTQEVSSNVASVTEAAGSTGQAASEVLQASRMLSEQAQKMRHTVEDFISKVNAA